MLQVTVARKNFGEHKRALNGGTKSYSQLEQNSPCISS